MGALRKFEVNKKVWTSVKIEKIKLSLTMPHPRADLLPQMPHPGEDKGCKNALQMPGGGGGVMRAVGIDGAIRKPTTFINLLL